MALIRLLNAVSSCLSQVSSARVGEGTATFWMNGTREVSVASPQVSRAASIVGSTPISAANSVSSCTLSSAVLAEAEALSPLSQPAITAVPSSSRASVSGVMRRCV